MVSIWWEWVPELMFTSHTTRWLVLSECCGGESCQWWGGCVSRVILNMIVLHYLDVTQLLALPIEIIQMWMSAYSCMIRIEMHLCSYIMSIHDIILYSCMICIFENDIIARYEILYPHTYDVFKLSYFIILYWTDSTSITSTRWIIW